MKKAIILCDENTMERGEVINVIVCDERGLKGFSLPLNQLIWDCTDFIVSVGDRWENGVFTHPDGTNAESYKSPEQMQIDKLREENLKLKEQNADIAEAVLNLQLESGGII